MKIICEVTLNYAYFNLTSYVQIDAVERLGGDVDLYGDTFHEAQARAEKRSRDEGIKLIPPFDDQDIIAGQATVGMEIARQMTGKVHAIFVPVGGGGLVSGIASYYKLVYPEVNSYIYLASFNLHYITS